MREHISQYRRGFSPSAISHIAYIFFEFPGDRSKFHKRVSLPLNAKIQEDTRMLENGCLSGDTRVYFIKFHA